MSICTSCGLEKDRESFSRDSHAKEGIASRCKDCCNAKSKARYIKNREAILERVRQYVASNKEAVKARKKILWEQDREANLKKATDRYRANPGPTKARSKSWREKNQGAAKAQLAKWRAENSMQMRAHSSARRARVNGADGSFSDADIEMLLRRQRGLCPVCRASLKHGYHIDHITPISRGGTNWPTNLQCLCPTCNLRKSAKDPIQFAQEQGFLL